MKSLHILLVEDNEGDILLTTEALEDTRLEIRISVAKDGKEAIDFMDKIAANPDREQLNLVLLDVNLPKKNGHEVLRYIKSIECLNHIPVIMLTTSSSQKDIDLSCENKVDCYLVKPIEAKDLLPIMVTLDDFKI